MKKDEEENLWLMWRKISVQRTKRVIFFSSLLLSDVAPSSLGETNKLKIPFQIQEICAKLDGIRIIRKEMSSSPKTLMQQ